MSVAIVTGAARGIGAATVAKLSENGWNVVAVDICSDDPQLPYSLGSVQDLQQLAEKYPRVVPVVGDVRDPAVCATAVATAEQRFGGVDAAVAAASVILGGKRFWETSPGELETLLAFDLMTVANMARATIPAMLRRQSPRSGRFIAIASAAAHTGLPTLTSYCAAKHAVLGLVRGLADDLAGTGITAVAVSPGSTRTPMLEATAALYGLANVDEFAVHQSVGRLLEPAEVAAMVAWLAGPEASGVAGTEVRVDGGFNG